MNLSFWIIQVLNALSLGTLLFLVAAGLSMIFGLMRIVNVAHGSFYMLGAYVALESLRLVHNQLVAALIAALAMGMLGALLQSTLIERLKNDNLPQILLTFGFLLVVGDFALIVWHGTAVILPPPPELAGSVRIAGTGYPVYRLFVIVAGIVLAIALDWLQTHTRMGAMGRAGVDDVEMLSCMGINVRRLFVIVFALGTAIAALGRASGGLCLVVH